ncbi:MAG: type II toxin-antitoxin system VapC family toxin [Acidobacteriota bacterium]|nr:type II toxin-antitoxin system VapC family toxin [Acidobacteriota bacterium]
MIQVVVDASIALAWCFPDETSDYAAGILVSLEGKTVLVPAIWSLEIANAILAGQRRKRLNQPEIKEFTTLLENLSLAQDVRPVASHVNDVLPLAHKHGLLAYVAAYLELSIRLNAPLATLDGKLQKAARLAGIPLFVGEAGK